jgi:AcrR family transcriptional regulator
MTAPETANADLGRRERRKLELRGRIVEAARELFDVQGFDATRVSEIAERADVAEKTFFNHFPTKQHVMRELAIESVGALLERVEEARRERATTRDRLFYFFSQVAEGAEQGGPMRRELMTEVIHALHDTSDESAQVQRVHEAFAAIVEDGLASGELAPSQDPETLTHVVLGAFYSLMFSWAHVPAYPLRAQCEATARFLADALQEPGPHPLEDRPCPTAIS